MNPWWWRIGVAVGAGAATLGLRQLRGPRGLAPAPRSSADLFPASTTVMGHRGAAAVAPENTMSGFGVAARLGVPFELDVRQCATGEVVALHDETLDRTTDGRGPITETPWPAVRALDAGQHFAPAFAGQRVPALDTVLATLGGQVVINVELKSPGSGHSIGPLVDAVIALLQAHEVTDRVMISASDPAMLAAVRAADARIRRGHILAPRPPASFFERLGSRMTAVSPDADLVMLERSLATAGTVSKLKKLGYRVFAWTVNREDDAHRLVAAGVDGLITDDPRRLLRVLAPSA